MKEPARAPAMRPLPLALAFASIVSTNGFSQVGAIDSSAMRVYEAHATAVTGQVSRLRDERPWAVSNGESVPIQQVITSGPDGYARFEVAGGSSFEIFNNSRVVFRQNA